MNSATRPTAAGNRLPAHRTREGDTVNIQMLLNLGTTATPGSAAPGNSEGAGFAAALQQILQQQGSGHGGSLPQTAMATANLNALAASGAGAQPPLPDALSALALLVRQAASDNPPGADTPITTTVAEAVDGRPESALAPSLDPALDPGPDSRPERPPTATLTADAAMAAPADPDQDQQESAPDTRTDNTAALQLPVQPPATSAPPAAPEATPVPAVPADPAAGKALTGAISSDPGRHDDLQQALPRQAAAPAPQQPQGGEHKPAEAPAAVTGATLRSAESAPVPPSATGPDATGIAVGNDSPVSQNARGSLPVISAPLATPQWGQQLGDQVVMMTRRGEQEISLKLNPAELGPLRVELRVIDHQAQVQLASASAQVRGAIDQALPQLRDALAEQGITLSQASVNDQRPDSRGQGFAAHQNPGNGNPAPAEDLVDETQAHATVALEGGVNLYV